MEGGVQVGEWEEEAAYEAVEINLAEEDCLLEDSLLLHGALMEVRIADQIEEDVEVVLEAEVGQTGEGTAVEVVLVAEVGQTREGMAVEVVDLIGEAFEVEEGQIWAVLEEAMAVGGWGETVTGAAEMNQMILLIRISSCGAGSISAEGWKTNDSGGSSWNQGGGGDKGQSWNSGATASQAGGWSQGIGFVKDGAGSSGVAAGRGCTSQALACEGGVNNKSDTGGSSEGRGGDFGGRSRSDLEGYEGGRGSSNRGGFRGGVRSERGGFGGGRSSNRGGFRGGGRSEGGGYRGGGYSNRGGFRGRGRSERGGFGGGGGSSSRGAFRGRGRSERGGFGGRGCGKRDDSDLLASNWNEGKGSGNGGAYGVQSSGWNQP